MEMIGQTKKCIICKKTREIEKTIEFVLGKILLPVSVFSFIPGVCTARH